MIPATIWTTIKELLECEEGLDYIKRVFEGRRFDIEPESLPCLMMEISADSPPERRANNVDLQTLEIDIYGFSSNNFNDGRKLIIGDNNYKGVLDVYQNLQKVIKDNSTLDETVYDIKMGRAIFDSIDIGKYPVRGFLLPLQIVYRQTDGE